MPDRTDESSLTRRASHVSIKQPHLLPSPNLSIFATMTTRKVQNIEDRESFGAWVNAQPEDQQRQHIVALANRAALRAAVFFDWPSKLNQSERNTARLILFRCNLISRVAVVNQTREVISAASTAIGTFVGTTVAARAASESIALESTNVTTIATTAKAAFDEADLATFSAFSAATSSSVADLEPAVTSAFSAFATSHNAFANFSVSDTSAASICWSALKQDATTLENGVSTLDLRARPLWLSEQPVSWTDARQKFAEALTTTEATAEHWPLWVQWYNSIAAGNPAFNLSESIADDLELRIALGDNRKDFWNRKPDMVNAEIAGWVKEAQASLIFTENQSSGLQFEWRDGLVRLARGLGLSSPKDDQRRIEAQLPVLLELVTKLEARITHGDVPRPEALVWAVTNLKKTIARKDHASIGATELFTATAILRSLIEQARTPAMGTNLFALDGPDLALSQSIALTSDMIVLATEEGRKLFDDADRAETDAGGLDLYRELEKQLFAIIAANGNVMESDTVELLGKVLLLDKNSPHPKRLAHLSAGSVRNAVLVTSIVSLAGAIGYALVSVTATSAMAAAAMAYIGKLVFGEGFKKSKLGELSNHTITNAINKMTARMIMDNRELLRKIAGDRPSYKSLRDLLDWVDEEQKKKTQKE